MTTPVTVVVEESEAVTTAGTTTTSMVVLLNRVWTPVARVPGATVESLPKVPQVIWHRRITVALEPGTRLERLIQRPRRQKASAADVLFGKSKGLTRQTQRFAFRVGPRGELTPD